VITLSGFHCNWHLDERKRNQLKLSWSLKNRLTLNKMYSKVFLFESGKTKSWIFFFARSFLFLVASPLLFCFASTIKIINCMQKQKFFKTKFWPNINSKNKINPRTGFRPNTTTCAICGLGCRGPENRDRLNSK
jgi:hypothetical protein